MATVTTAHDVDTLTGTIPSIHPAAPIVLDFGKQRRKAVRQLRKGAGKLIEEVSAALDELRSSGAIAPGAQPVIIVVQQKNRKNRGLLPGF